MASSGRKSNDELLAAELAAGKTVKDAADAVHVSERTATRRMADPDFRERVSLLRGEMIGRAAGRLADGMGEAAGVLRALLTDADANIRFRAAGKLIELGVKVVELSELEQRVVELEAYLAETSKGGRGP